MCALQRMQNLQFRIAHKRVDNVGDMTLRELACGSVICSLTTTTSTAAAAITYLSVQNGRCNRFQSCGVDGLQCRVGQMTPCRSGRGTTHVGLLLPQWCSLYDNAKVGPSPGRGPLIYILARSCATIKRVQSLVDVSRLAAFSGPWRGLFPGTLVIKLVLQVFAILR